LEFIDTVNAFFCMSQSGFRVKYFLIIRCFFFKFKLFTYRIFQEFCVCQNFKRFFVMEIFLNEKWFVFCRFMRVQKIRENYIIIPIVLCEIISEGKRSDGIDRVEHFFESSKISMNIVQKNFHFPHHVSTHVQFPLH
jgi:hypothetical protein